jgi:hypothetical protein
MLLFLLPLSLLLILLFLFLLPEVGIVKNIPSILYIRRGMRGREKTRWDKQQLFCRCIRSTARALHGGEHCQLSPAFEISNVLFDCFAGIGTGKVNLLTVRVLRREMLLVAVVHDKRRGQRSTFWGRHFSQALVPLLWMMCVERNAVVLKCRDGW